MSGKKRTEKKVTSRPSVKAPEDVASDGITTLCRDTLNKRLGSTKKAAIFTGEARGFLRAITTDTEHAKKIARGMTKGVDYFGKDAQRQVLIEWLAQLSGDEKHATLVANAMGASSSLVAIFMLRNNMPMKHYGSLLALVMCARAKLDEEETTSFFEEMHRFDSSEAEKAKKMKSAIKAMANGAKIDEADYERIAAQIAALASKKKSSGKAPSAASSDEEMSERSDEDAEEDADEEADDD